MRICLIGKNLTNIVLARILANKKLTIDIIYNSDKWPIDLDKSFAFQIVEKGSNYLIKEFPDKKEYEDAKEKVQEL